MTKIYFYRLTKYWEMEAVKMLWGIFISIMFGLFSYVLDIPILIGVSITFVIVIAIWSLKNMLVKYEVEAKKAKKGFE